MKVIQITHNVLLVRHWGTWYRVQRAAGKWDKLSPIIKLGHMPRIATIDSALDSLRVAQPISLPDLDK